LPLPTLTQATVPQTKWNEQIKVKTPTRKTDVLIG
jgi:hypothetical protein